MSELEEIPYTDSFNYIEYIGEKLEDRKLIKINRFLQEDRINKNKEIERLNNIIKEVREYMNKHEIEPVYLDCKLYETQAYKDILEILDKGE